MVAMNPILRLRRAFRSMGVEAEQADESADAVAEYAYSRSDSDQRFERMMSEYRREMAEFRNQVVLAVFLAAGLIIGAVGLIIALVD